MSLPCPQFFTDYFDQYAKKRAADRASITSYLKYGAEKVSGIWTRKDPVIEQIEKIRKYIESEIQLIDTKKLDDRGRFHSWFALIFKLEAKAKEVQGLKYPQFTGEEEESLFCETLHGLRNYIIYKLTNNDDHYKEWYNECFNTLLKERQTIKDKLYSTVKNDHGKDGKELKLKLKKMTLTLAMLEDAEAITDADMFNQLDYLKIYDQSKLLFSKSVEPDYVNEAIPYCLHKNFWRSLYRTEYQKITNISAEEFEKNAEKKYALLIEQKKEEDRLKKIQKSFLESKIDIEHPKLNPLADFEEIALPPEVQDPHENSKGTLANTGLFAKQAENLANQPDADEVHQESAPERIHNQ